MAKFGITSKTRLATCHPDLQTLFNYVIKYFDCTIVCGHRNKRDQDKAFNEKKSQVKYPDSKHNKYPSMAVDAAPWEKDHIDWSKDQMYYFSGFVLGIAKMLLEYGAIDSVIRLGSDWDGDNDIQDQTFIDSPHFEIKT